MKKATEELSPADALLPNPELFLLMHELRLPTGISSDESKGNAMTRLINLMVKDGMSYLYKAVCQEFTVELDMNLVEGMEKKNEEELRSLEASLVDAKENFGDVEIRDCMIMIANFHCRVGNFDQAIESYQSLDEKLVGSGSRLNIMLTLIRIGIFLKRRAFTKKQIETAKIVCKKEGDWERRNKLKVYEAIFHIQNRRLHEAAELLLGSIAIFTASEVLSYESFISITVILSMMTLDRPLLKSKVIESPEAIQVLESDGVLKDFLHSYYYCRYNSFFEDLVEISKRVERDLFLHTHVRFFVRVMRLKAYNQFLEPYSSVTVSSMAHAFGVSEEFVENDVSDYISNGKLSCKIDRVNNVIVYIKARKSEELCAKALKKGDLLLSKIQKLSKIIDM